MDLKSLVIVIIGLAIGAFLAEWIMPLVPFATEGWIAGIIMGIIQMIILVVLGAVTGSDLVTILLGGIIIFVGAIVGGFVMGWVGFSGLIATILIFVIQAMLLMLTGFVKGGKAVIPIKKGKR